MKATYKILPPLAFLCFGFAAWKSFQPQVGKPTDAGIMVATGQTIKPAGPLAVFNGRPVDLVVSPDGNFAYLKENRGLTVIDCHTMKVVREIKIPGGSSFFGLALSTDAKTLCYTSSGDKLVVFDVSGDNIAERKTIKLPTPAIGTPANPCGITFEDPSHVFVCLNRENCVARVDLKTDTVEKWPTDVAPFGVAYEPRNRRLYVSCWSRAAKQGERQAPSSGTNVPVDPRGVGLGGRLTAIDLESGKTVSSTPIGHHAAEVDLVGGDLYVPCSGSDTVERVSTSGASRKTISLFPNQPVGAAPASMAFSGDGNTAYVSCSGRNSVLVYDLQGGKAIGEYATAWYPTTARLVGGKLFVACTKGIGERAEEKNPNSHNSWDLTGALCVIPTDQKPTPLSHVAEPAARHGIGAKPLPERTGETSLFKHIVYVIRENRTYDQVFGDMKEGDGEPSLCNFGERITPNAHALAKEYCLLDNYYCNGICSADGHSWATEGNATANLERSVSAWPRSYPFGDDALNTSSTGFLWDEILEAGKSFVNFGEFDYAATANKESYAECLREHFAGTSKIKFKQNIGVARMRKYTVPGYPGWDLSIPDVLRADIFVRNLAQMEMADRMPNLTILYLCCDHTGGPVTAKAQVADNDLALGMCVEALTKSKFWKDTCIFVEEDDPQNGWDHVDGHRSPCLVISPYSRGLGRIGDFYNQCSVYRSIEHILGVRTKSRFVEIAPLMFSCFTGKFDPVAYSARQNRWPLDETVTNGLGENFDLSKPDLVDDKRFNRALWAQTMPARPYPADFEGAHGKGLAKRGLVANGTPDQDQ